MTDQPENALLAAEAEIARLTEERDQHWDADRAEITSLRAQRDQLLAALRDVTDLEGKGPRRHFRRGG
jgi:hypothetical protein